MFIKAHSSFLVRLGIIVILMAGLLGVQSARPVQAATLVVTNTNDSGAGSLRQAITDAVSGDTITFNLSLSGQMITLETSLIIDKDLTIDGSGLPSRISINGNNSVRLFFIPLGITVEMDSLIMMNGNATGSGGAIYTEGSLAIIDSIFVGNTAGGGGAISCNAGISSLIIINSTYSSNQASSSQGGALATNCSTTIINSTFSSNSAANSGGALHINSDMQPSSIVNSTFYSNTAVNSAGGIANFGTLTIINSTFSHNSSPIGGAIRNGLGGMLSLRNSILANSVSGVDCIKSDSTTEVENINNLIETTGMGLESCGTPLLFNDPVLGSLQENGGNTWTMALGSNSPAIDTGDDANCLASDQRGVTRPQGAGCDIGAFEAEYTLVNVTIGNSDKGSHPLVIHGSRRQSFAGVNSGPVKIRHIENTPVIAAERVIYKVDGVNTSFSEMMGLPHGQLDNVYWLPWYNNVNLDTQLRFANATNNPATVTITIDGVAQPTINLGAGESTRISYPDIDAGPVKIESTQNIVASERIIYKVNGVHTSFSEMMALPESQLDNVYWLPWYNNVNLDTQLRFANVTNNPATVTVTVGGVAQTPINLGAGESTRISYPGVDAGPVKIESTQNIVAAERVIYKVNNVNTSFSEMMALPEIQLDNTYWLPWYNNVNLDTQLRFANVSANLATVTVTIGGVAQTPINLAAGESTRISYPGIDSGPVKIESTQTIVAAERVIYKVNNIPTSFSEMMALPDSLLSTLYWFPWYNNVNLDTQLRFGAP